MSNDRHMGRLRELLFSSEAISNRWVEDFVRVTESVPDWRDLCRHLIGSTYASTPDAEDAYSRVGCFLARTGNAKEAFEWFERDFSERRAGWYQQLRRAECLAVCGDLELASREVQHVYAKYPDAVNGFAGIAWTLRTSAVLASSYAFALPDVEHGRISSGFMLNVAVLAASEGHLDAALGLVKNAYAANSSLKDGYVRVATAAYGSTVSDRTKVFCFYEKDHTLGRLSPERMIFLSQWYADNGNLEAALALAENAYNLDGTFRDRLSSIAWKFRARGDAETALRLLKDDYDRRRQSPTWTLNYAIALQDIGDNATATDLAHSLAAEDLPSDHERLKYASLLARLGELDVAKTIVHSLYENPGSRILDGYASLGAAIQSTHAVIDVLDLYQLDASLHRLSPPQRLRYASLLARTRSWDKALSELALAYEGDARLVDGRVSLAKDYLLPQKSYAQALALVQEDLAQKRLSQKGLLFLSTVESLATRQQARLRRLTYQLPSVLFSFPRSGSNFLQSVLSSSADLVCQSIYAPRPVDISRVLSLKSHSPSLEHFAAEWTALTGSSTLPQKAIVLVRDPRDIMISFRDFTETKRSMSIQQNRFLEHTDYFFACGPDRRTYLRPLSVADAFRQYVATWYSGRSGLPFETLLVRYEDLVSQPEESFKRVFHFLDLDCDLNVPSLGNKVSLYSASTGRARGRPFGWQSLRQTHATIVDSVLCSLGNEVSLLEYDRPARSPSPT